MASRKKSPAYQSHPARTAVVVLGMHRSGTSAMAGVLGLMGCDLPQDLMGPAEINAKGFFESNKVTGLNEELLASAGQRWFDFPPFPDDWFASPKAGEFLERAGAVIAKEYGRSHLFALKDPRICRLLPFWRQVLGAAGCRPAYVCIHRHPQDVAASLTRWANYDAGYGLLLWLRHVLDAEAESRGQARVFTSYDRLMADWAGTVRAIGKGLNLTWPRRLETAAAGVEDFLSAELQHFSHAKSEGRRANALPDWVAETYAILESWAAGGEQAADHKRLDRIRAGLDYASPTFAGVAWRSQEQRLQLQHLLQRIDHLEGPVQQAHQEALQHSRAEAEARIGALNATLNEALAASAGHAANHRTEQQNRATAEASAAEVQARLDHAQAEAAGHAANHLTEQQHRHAAEARIADLSEGLKRISAEAEARIAELSGALELAQTATRTHEADRDTEQRGRAGAEARIAELSLTLGQAQAHHAAALEEAERLLSEARGAAQGHLGQLAQGEAARQSLQDAKATLEDDLRRSQELRVDAEHEASQLRSALIQRSQEADDLHRQTAEDAQRLTDLETALEAARREHADLTRQEGRNARHLEILTRRVTEQLRQDLENRLTPPVDHEAIAREQRAQIDDYEIRLTYNRKTRAAAEADLARVEAEKAGLANEAGSLRGLVVKHGHEIHALKKSLETRQSDLDAITLHLAEVEAQAEAAAMALKAQLQQLQADRQNLMSAAEALQGNLDAAARKGQDLQNRLLDRQQEVKQTREELADLTKEHKSTLRRVTLLREERKAQEQRLQELAAELEGLIGSLSWRVTGPVRALSGALRRVVPRRKG